MQLQDPHIDYNLVPHNVDESCVYDFDYDFSLWEGTVRGFLHYSQNIHYVQYLKPVSVNSLVLIAGVSCVLWSGRLIDAHRHSR